MSTATNKPDFYVYGSTPRDKGRRDLLTRIGAAWNNDKGAIGITIDAVPLSFFKGEGKLVLFPPKSAEAVDAASEDDI